MEKALRVAAKTPYQTGFVLLETPESAYTSRLALVQQAEHTLDLQYYIIHADSSTNALLKAIRSAAQRGVRIRILLDDFHSKGRDAQVMQLAFEPNIEVRLFNPLPGGRSLGNLRVLVVLRDFERLQRRMHNKLFLADNVVGIVGGRNLGQAYFGHAQSSNFADLDVMAMGALVPQMSLSFDNYWNHALAYPVQTLMSKSELDILLQSQNEVPFTKNKIQNSATAIPHSMGMSQAEPSQKMPAAMKLAQAPWVWAPSVLLVDRPTKFEGQLDQTNKISVIHDLMMLMQEAHNEILIVSPYFVPGPSMMKVFAQLRQRGVRVRVLTNSLAANDAPIAHIGYARWRKPLLNLGVELYEMRADQRKLVRNMFTAIGKSKQASLHAKVIVIDDTVLGVGSMNLDLRSYLSNSEVALLVYSSALAQSMRQRMEEVMSEGAWRVILTRHGQLQWRMQDGHEPVVNQAEPDASVPLQLWLKIATPFAPDELL